jgi:hypothetical protein
MDPPPPDTQLFYGTPTPRTRPSTVFQPPPLTPGPPPTPVPSSQPRQRAPKRDIWEKADTIIHLITKDFRSLGHEGLPDLLAEDGADVSDAGSEQKNTLFGRKMCSVI